jgi:hypothetical protein
MAMAAGQTSVSAGAAATASGTNVSSLDELFSALEYGPSEVKSDLREVVVNQFAEGERGSSRLGRCCQGKDVITTCSSLLGQSFPKDLLWFDFSRSFHFELVLSVFDVAYSTHV